MNHLFVIAACLLVLVGCSGVIQQPNIAGRVRYTPSLAPLVGDWDAEDGFALIVKRVGDELVVDNPPSDIVHYEISKCTVDGASISFTQFHHMKDGSYNAFSDVACRCTIEPVGGQPDSLKFTLSSPQMPEGDSEVYTRRK